MLRFALKNMAVRKVKLLLVVLSVVISAGVALISYNVSKQVEEGIVNTAAYYDIIIGPSGSSTQLAMNTMFFTDEPLGTVPFEIVEQLSVNPQVNEVVPFTMGDSFNGARIVGTTPAFLNGKKIADGEMFKEVYEAVVGSAVASKYGLKIGDPMVTSHGLSGHGSEHESSPLVVTGILETTHTAYDNAVFTGYKTVWAVHGLEEEHEHEEGEEHDHEHEEGEEEHEHEHAGEGTVCAILVKTKSFNAYYAITGQYSADASLLVINPSTVLREVLDNVDLSSQIVYVLCAVILVMNIFVISVITLLNMYDAKKEIALMRMIGVSMGRIQLLFLIQNAFVGLVSTVLALIVSSLGLSLMGGYVAGMGIVLNAWTVYPMEFAIMALVFVISVLPTVVCTWNMARKGGLDG